MKILLFRSNNIFDSRVNKYKNYYDRKRIDYTIVGWDRVGNEIDRKHYNFFKYRAGEAVGGIRAIINHLRWMFFVFCYLKNNRDVTTIHACDLNSAFPAALYKFFLKKDVILIFDACDWFSANFYGKFFVKYLFDKMERFACKWANHLIICEPERENQIQFKLKKKPLVMRNIPEVDMSKITEVQRKYKFDNGYPTIAYLGGFANGRFLPELLSLVENGRFNLLIAGSGDKYITQKCEDLNRLSNFRYFGRLNMIDGLNMENAADAIYAMYCKINPNHIYAAPNKYYEALLLGKPLITTKGTIVGDKVRDFDTGWEIDENIEKLSSLVNSFSSDALREKGTKAFELWNDRFKNSLYEFFEHTYSKIIK